MKITNKNRVIAASVCFLGILFACFAFNIIDIDKQTYRNLEKGRVTGELLFKGLFFGNEAISKYVPEIKPAASKNLAEEQLSENMVKYIKEKQPHFFNEFKKDIESGDHIVISLAIDKSLELYKESITELKKRELLSPQSSVFAYESICVTSIVAVDISNADQLAAMDQKLLRDKIIDSIAKNLRA